jgi:hypothetical protein
MRETTMSRRASLQIWLALPCAAAALVIAHGDAAAGAGRVVVLGFEGPPAVADDTRTEVVNLVAHDHDVVAPKRWVKARRAAEEKDVGPRAWARASREAGVDAVIEGAVHGERGRYVLTLAARDARSGNEIDTIEIDVGKNGLSRQARGRLREQLGDLLDWVDGSGEAARGLDDESLEGGEDLKDLEEDGDGGDDGDDDGDGEEEAPKDKEKAKAKPAVRGNDLVALFREDAADDAEEPETPGTAHAATAPAGPRARHIELTGGGYVLSRTFDFLGGENLPAGYPGRMARGLRVAAAVFPSSRPNDRGRMSGFGVGGEVSRSVGSYVDVDNNGEILDLPVTQTRWSVAAKYRRVKGGTTLEGSVGYGGLSHFIDDVPEDAGDDFDLMDGEYQELEVGGRVELAIGPSARLGFGLTYLYPTDAGEITAPDLLGSAGAWGIEGTAELQINVGASMYVAAGADYRRLSLSFAGDGDMMSTFDVDSALDIYTGAHLGAGTRF